MYTFVLNIHTPLRLSHGWPRRLIAVAFPLSPRSTHTLFFANQSHKAGGSMAGKEEFNWHQQRRIYSSGHEHHPTALTSAPRRNTRATRIAMLLQKKEHSFEVSHFGLYPILSR